MSDDIFYTVRQSARARRLSIHVDLEGSVEVVRPLRIAERRAHAFVRERKRWVLRTVAKQKLRASKKKNFRWTQGEVFPFLGEELTLSITEGNKQTRVFHHGNVLHVCIPVASASVIRSAVEDWYRNRAREFFATEVLCVTRQLKVKHGRIAVKDQRTVWGSCSKKGNLNFSWRLLMAPREVAEYIVVHECAHLIHLNHSANYWSVVQSLMPEYKKYEKWLKEQGMSLR